MDSGAWTLVRRLVQDVLHDRGVSTRERWEIAARRAGTHTLIVFPPLFMAWLFWVSIRRDVVALDFEHAYVPAARAVVHGLSPYSAKVLTSGEAFVYPPLTAWLASPFLALPALGRDLVVSSGVLLVVLATLRVMGVRDWRCYAIPFLWPPVYLAVQTGNVIVLVVLLCAVAWRWRDRPVVAGLAVGAMVALKLFAWPLVLFFFATRRLRAGVVAAVAVVGFVFLPWAAIGFNGLGGYPHLLSSLDHLERADSYTVGALVAPVVGWPAAQAVTIVGGVSLLTFVVLRRRNERAAFALALATCLELSPIVWMSYFVLLLAALPLRSSRLSWVWVAPVALWAAPMAGERGGAGNGAPWQTALALVLVGVLLVGPAVERRRRLRLVEPPISVNA
jgi:glycosyl transferase family 87